MIWLHRRLHLGNEAEMEIQDRFSALYAHAGSPRGMMLLGLDRAGATDLYLKVDPTQAPQFDGFAEISGGAVPRDARLLLGHGDDYEIFRATHGG